MEKEESALEAACLAKNIRAVWAAIAHIDKKKSAPVLAKLLLDGWHEAHEDIVFELGLMGEPCAIEYITKSAQVPLEYLVKWGNQHEFQRKCAYALARIGTPESREALEVLAQHADPHLREYGEEGLQHWPLPYRGGKYA